MMPLDPVELSAYLDGELSAERMREIESILASDPIARAEFEALAAADANWRKSARSAAFHPNVDLPFPSEDAISIRMIGVVVASLIIMQYVLKQLDVIALTLALNGVALAIVLIGVVFLVKPGDMRPTQPASEL